MCPGNRDTGGLRPFGIAVFSIKTAILCDGWGALSIFVDNQYVEGSSTPLSATDPDGNTYQERRLADGASHRVLKNFPTQADLRNAVGDAGTNVRYVDFTYYWCLSYTLRE